MVLCVMLAATGAGFAGDASATGEIILDRAFPTHKEQVRLRITDDAGNPVSGAVVSVTYRPGSSVSATDEIGRSSDGGVLQWTPMDAGLATITATWAGPEQDDMSSSTTVSVRFQSPPVDGILIMVIAGLVLIVGSVIRVYKLLRAPDFN